MLHTVYIGKRWILILGERIRCKWNGK